MAYEEKYRMPEMPQNITMEDRRRLTITGVEDIESFDDLTVIANTTRGTVAVKGHELRLEKLSLDSGEVVIEGTIDSVEYEDDVRVSEGFFSRLFH